MRGTIAARKWIYVRRAAFPRLLPPFSSLAVNVGTNYKECNDFFAFCR
jgi:hypothetical protein